MFREGADAIKTNVDSFHEKRYRRQRIIGANIISGLNKLGTILNFLSLFYINQKERTPELPPVLT